jgi:hypothetical protein
LVSEPFKKACESKELISCSRVRAKEGVEQGNIEAVRILLLPKDCAAVEKLTAPQREFRRSPLGLRVVIAPQQEKLLRRN